MRRLLITYFLLLSAISFCQTDMIDSLYNEISRLDLNLPTEIGLYYDILDLDSTEYGAILGMGKAYYSRWKILGRIDKVYLDSAQIMLDKACDSEDSDYKAFVARGELFFDFSIYDYALIDFNKALDLNQDLFQVRWQRAKVYMINSSYDMAILDLEKAIKLEPDYDWLYLMRANCYANMNELNYCNNDLRLALKLNPTNNDTHMLFGDLYALKGNYKKAIRKYTSILTRNNLYALAYLKRGNAYFALGQTNNANSDWDIAEKSGFVIDENTKTIKFGKYGYKLNE